jgi:regulator of cell morphogenesis and NO signaling
MPSPTPDTPLGTLVSDRPARSRVFEALGIDYCCQGDRTLAEACRDRDLDPDTAAQMLDAAVEAGGPREETSWADAPLEDLIEHIESTHHAYLRRELPRLEELIGKVVDAHGDQAPWLEEIQDVFGDLKPHLEHHMDKEESTVFPFIASLTDRETESMSVAIDGRQMALMEDEHDESSEALDRFRELTGGYEAPEWACPTLEATIQGLKDLEKDMHQHVHEENNVLFPRARDLIRGESEAA